MLKLKFYCQLRCRSLTRRKEINPWIHLAQFGWLHGYQGGVGGRLKGFSAFIGMEASRGKKKVEELGMPDWFRHGLTEELQFTLLSKLATQKLHLLKQT